MSSVASGEKRGSKNEKTKQRFVFTVAPLPEVVYGKKRRSYANSTG
jgi:hypothetical protein